MTEAVNAIGHGLIDRHAFLHRGEMRMRDMNAAIENGDDHAGARTAGELGIAEAESFQGADVTPAR